MRNPDSARVVRSALDQWEAVDKLKNAAKRLLPPEDAELLEGPVRQCAEEALGVFGDEDEAPSESTSLRQKLRKLAAGGS